MADDSLGNVLENRYATEHVGGAFDAKHIPKPKSIEQAQDAATMGRKVDESLMLEGLNTERYVWHDTILGEKPQQSLYGVKRSVEPKVAKPANTPLRSPVITKTFSDRGQGVRTNAATIPSITPGSTLRIPIVKKPVVLGQNGRMTTTKAEPSGNGMPGVPSSRPFTPRAPRPFGPLIDMPVPIYWNTDPDMWDYTKLVGQTNWDS